MLIEYDGEIYETCLQHVQIEITGCCNMRCKHCRASGEVKKNLPLEQIEKVFKIIEKTRDDDFRLILSGGEPFVNKDIIKILELAKKYKINSIVITTNGSLVTDSLLETMNQFNFDFLCLQVSLDSLDESTHDEFRGYAGAFKKCIQLINKIKSYDNIESSIRMTITPKTLPEVNKMIDFALEQGVKIIGIGSVIPFGKASSGAMSLSPNEKKKFLEILAKRHVELDGKIDVTSEDPLKFQIDCSPWNYCQDDSYLSECFFGGCTAGITTFNVSSDGTITPCAMLDEKILNLYDFDNVDEIIDSYGKNNVIVNLFSRKFNGKCGKCKYNRVCGGCRAFAKASTGDYMGSDWSCWSNENN